MAIPVIDFSKIDGDERAETLAQIHHCCVEWGFFQLINHGISEELLERVKKVSTECYKLEREMGFKNSKPVQLLNELVEKGHDYDDEGRVDNVDWEDVFFLSDENVDQWSPRTPKFKETMYEYRTQLKELAIKMMEIFDENLRLPKGYIREKFENPEKASPAFFGTKISHYPPCPNPEKIDALRAHTDAGGVILLFQDDQVKGLQILKDGSWIDVQPLQNAIVVNTGDQIEVLSNGKYKSVWHRVVASKDGNRRSVASFYNPSIDAVIEPAQELVDDDDVAGTKLKYPKFVFGDYMSVYAQQKFTDKEPRFRAVKGV